MKLLFGLVITIFAAVVLAQRASTTFEPMNWSATTGMMGPSGFPVATKKDLLVYYDTSSAGPPPPATAKRALIGVNQPVMSIRRRNADGVYEYVGNFTEITSPYVSTNGKWVVLQSMGMVLFSVDSNNQISNASYAYTYGGYLLSDDTFVGWISNDVGNYTISTYQYEASNNTWNTIPGTELIITTTVRLQGEFSTYRASDTHLVIIDTTNTTDVHIQIYSRQADKSWKFIESLPVNSSYVQAEREASVTYNGVDTLTFVTTEADANTTGIGIMYVYTKSNGQWTEQTFTASSVGYRPEGNLGTVTTFLDANTLLVTADLEGYNFNGGAPDNIGKVLVMTRNSNGMWEPTLDLNNPTGAGVWGSAIGVNDYDIVIPNVNIVSGGSLTFYTAPVCFMQPINVTCADQQVNDCSDLTISSLYTVNNAQCGAVSSTLNGLSLVNNKAVQAQFSFSRHFGATAYCNATVTCPVPPAVVVQQPSSPSKVSSAVVLVHSCLASLLLGFILLFA